jgi:hypothetical protein
VRILFSLSSSVVVRRARLRATESERLNNIHTGVAEEPWRKDPIDITLPSGRTETLHLLKDPKISVRESLHHATELAENGDVIDAAVNVYVGMVLTHPFKDANRRSGVVAAHYFLSRYDVPISGLALHELGLGDVRDPSQIDVLKETLRQMAKFASRRR